MHANAFKGGLKERLTDFHGSTERSPSQEYCLRFSFSSDPFGPYHYLWIIFDRSVTPRKIGSFT